MTDLIRRPAVIEKLKRAYWDKNIQSAKNDPCVIDAMIDWAIRIVNEMPLESPWHTGTPIYRGRYLVSNGYDTSISYFDGKEFIKDFLGFPDVGDIIKWQKIEP